MNKKMMNIFYVALLVIASKRGVLMVLVFIFGCFLLFSKTVRRRNKFIGLISIMFIIVMITLYTSNINNIHNFHIIQMQPLLYKLHRMNPLGDNFGLYLSNDPRVNEVRSAFRYFDFRTFLLGGGPGFTYDFFDVNSKLLEVNRHNTHFTPVSLLTKYGVIYVSIIYIYLLSVVFSNRKKFKSRNIYCVILLYIIGSIAYTFVSFGIYINYLMLAFIGLIKNYEENVCSERVLKTENKYR